MASSQEVGPGEIRYPDVLLGRGQAVHHHAGNVAFRKEVRARSLEYVREGSALRNYITKEIIRRVNTAGGRFLKPAKEGVMLWVECPQQIIRTKVKQALRDDAKKRKRDASLARNLRKTFDMKSGEIQAEGSSTIPTLCTVSDHQFLNGRHGFGELGFTNQSTVETRFESIETRMSRFRSSSLSIPCSGLSSLLRDPGSVVMGLPQTPPLALQRIGFNRGSRFNQPISLQELTLLMQTNSHNPFTAMTPTQLSLDYLMAEYLRDRSKSDEEPRQAEQEIVETKLYP